MSKIIGFAREASAHESRTLLVPADVPQLVEAGFEVRVESGIGDGLGILDETYWAAGASVQKQETLWASPLVLKFKAPDQEHLRFLRPGLAFASFLHAEGDIKLAKMLASSGASFYALEFFRTADGYFPMSVADSEIAGKLGVIYGAYHLQKQQGGRGVLLGRVVGASPARVLVIGYGNAGAAAVQAALGLGAEVVVLGRNRPKLRAFAARFDGLVRCEVNTPETLEREAAIADLIIGAIQISTFDTPPMLTDEVLAKMKRGAMIVDVTCGYGSGYLPTFDHSTTFADPVYERDGVLHCKIDRLPAATPFTTSEAVSRLVTPYLVAFGDAVLGNGPADPISAAGLVISDGDVVHPEVVRHVRHHEHLRVVA